MKALVSKTVRKVIALLLILMVSGTGNVFADVMYYVHTDHLGTPTVITDSTQKKVWQGNKQPFGKAEVSVNLIEFNVRFPGQYYDAESGLHYNYFRDYDPSLGRYVQSDPIGLDGGLNSYSYAYQNPLSYTDPKGLTPAAAGLCFIPGVGWVGCGVAAAGVGGAALLCYLTGACQNLGKACGDAWSAWNESSNEEADSGDKDPSTPTGRRGSPLDVEDGTNKPTTIGGREYSGHALDRLQGRGVPPSAVEDAIQNGASSPGNQPGTTKHTGDNGVTVITNDTGKVVTVITR